MSDPTPSESTPTPPTTPVADAPGSPGAAPAPDRPQYEFDDAQNQVINNLAMSIIWVRVPLLIVGLLEAIIATGLALRLPKDGAHIVSVIGHALAAVICFLLANWLLRAASEFIGITTTKGRDITHLMDALKSLDSWFDTLAFFVKLYLALLGVLIFLLLLGLLTESFRESV